MVTRLPCVLLLLESFRISGSFTHTTQVLESDMPEDQKRSALKQLAQRSPYLRVLVPWFSGNFSGTIVTMGSGMGIYSMGPSFPLLGVPGKSPLFLGDIQLI